MSDVATTLLVGQASSCHFLDRQAGCLSHQSCPKSTERSHPCAKGADTNTVLLQEVGPRDGLQNEAVILSPEVRADLVERLVDAGLGRIQIGSFVQSASGPSNGRDRQGLEAPWEEGRCEVQRFRFSTNAELNRL